MPANNQTIFSDPTQMDQFLVASQTAARLGGEVLMKMLGQAKVWKKGPGDWVTQADFASQSVIREYLIGLFPDHQFLGEEDEEKENAIRESRGPTSLTDKKVLHHKSHASAEFCWIVDPLDGTTNYVHQLTSFSVSIALRHRNPQTGEEQILVGTVFDPVLEECFSASLGGGAKLNGNPIRVSECRILDEALTVFSMGSRNLPDSPPIKRLLNVLATSSTVRRLGSAALNLCYVACGRVDAYWATNLNAWDVAAGWLIANEAGACLRDFDNQPLQLLHPKFCCSGTPELFNELQPLLNVSNT